MFGPSHKHVGFACAQSMQQHAAGVPAESGDLKCSHRHAATALATSVCLSEAMECVISACAACCVTIKTYNIYMMFCTETGTSASNLTTANSAPHEQKHTLIASQLCCLSVHIRVMHVWAVRGTAAYEELDM